MKTLEATQITPGPWHDTGEIDKTRGFITTTVTNEHGEDGFVAVVYGETREQCEANARLIAAAPDLLEALRESLLQLEYLQAFSGGTIMTHMQEERLGRTIWRVNAAIAKAEGR